MKVVIFELVIHSIEQNLKCRNYFFELNFLTESTLGNNWFGGITRFSWTSLIDCPYPELVLRSFFESVNSGLGNVTFKDFTLLPIFVEFTLELCGGEKCFKSCKSWNHFNYGVGYFELIRKSVVTQMRRIRHVLKKIFTYLNENWNIYLACSIIIYKTCYFDKF